MLLLQPLTLPFRIVRWALTLAGVWATCLLGLCLSSYGYATALLRIKRVPRNPDTSLVGIERPKVSVVVPTYMEADNIKATLESVVRACKHVNAAEFIVVDGGSTDNTVAVARATLAALPCSSKLLTSSCGRAMALNVGAEQVTGDIIVFVHADCIMPDGYDELVRNKLRETRVVAGAFTFAVNRASFLSKKVPTGLSVMEAFANFRSRNYQLPYGDQALFMTRERYRRVGPYPNYMMMEDVELVRRLRTVAIQEGGRLVTIDAPVMCSGRRWERNGVPKNTLLNQVFVFSYVYLGVSPTKVYDWYYGTSFATTST